ncbi:MAG: L-type lectin-domain containing protein [Solirubrobacterales bacterium]
MNSFSARLSLALAASSLLVFAASASAGTFNYFSYPDFSSTAGLQLNDNAKQEGNVLRLTAATPFQNGSAFTTTAFDPQQSFETQFQISMHDSTCCLSEPADGIAFLIQSKGPDGGEGTGGSLGYGGIAPSVAVEFDIYHNVIDPLGSHVAITSEGKTENHLACANESGPSAPCTAGLPFPLYGAAVYAWVTYDATTQHLAVFVSQSATKPPAPLLDHQISLAPLGNAAFPGFTAATGSHNAVHDVHNWWLGPKADPLPPPAVPPKKPKPKCPKKGKGKKGKGKAKGKASASKKAKAKGKGKGKGKGKKCGKRKKGPKKGKSGK